MNYLLMALLAFNIYSQVTMNYKATPPSSGVAEGITVNTQETIKNITAKGREELYEVTAYTASADECGGKTDGITASGEKAKEGVSISADNLPFYTKVLINGKIYTVHDRFGGDYQNRIDIYMQTKEEAVAFGRQQLKVVILENE